MNAQMPSRREILAWLRCEDTAKLEELWQRADEVRRSTVGDDVHLRGLVEFSNHCSRHCAYCGLRAPNTSVERYRLTEDQIMDCAAQAVALNYGTLVLQSGEDPGLDPSWMARVVSRVKQETPLAVTLSLGERSSEELKLWKDAGADRYLLRFETSNTELFRQIHPTVGGEGRNRVEMLREIKRLGYDTGSGVMVGIPGQTYESLADDLELFVKLDLDMIGIGPFIQHPETPLGKLEPAKWQGKPDQAQNDELTTYKMIALTRLLRPFANIPSTTALATLNKKNGRELGLKRGANVVMPNVTPVDSRVNYQIYPDKACLTEDAQTCGTCLSLRFAGIGRRPGRGRGDSLNRLQRMG